MSLPMMRAQRAVFSSLRPSLSSRCCPRAGARYLSTRTGVLSQGVPAVADDIDPRKDPVMTDKYIGMTGAQIFHQVLGELKVDTVFGYPGGAILQVFDAIYNSENFDFVLARHEQGAGHMAEGFARARADGQPGVVLVTSGPGATNTVTPMQDALMDGTPMVVFTGQVAKNLVGTDAFQEADILGITRPCTKWNVQVRHVNDIARNIREAFHIATTGRPGPVLVDLPKDVTAMICQGEVIDEPQLLGYYDKAAVKKENRIEQSREIQQAAHMLNNAKRPVILLGQGVVQADASELITELIEKHRIPVVTTLMGMGCYDERKELSLHMLGMHGALYANKAIQNADVILNIGARFDDRVTGKVADFAPAARRAFMEGTGGIIHVDIAAKQIGKIIPVAVTIVGDALHNIEELKPLLEGEAPKEWVQQCIDWKKKYPFRYRRKEEGKIMKPQRVIEELYTQTAGRKDVLITTGVGQHQMWACQFYRWTHPGSIITSGGLGTMGYGLPAAIGAKIAKPDTMVIDIDGDASLVMTMMEMATAREFNVNVKVLLLNNDFQGMVKQWQDLFFKERHSGTVMTNPNFTKAAEAFGWRGLRCDNEEDLPAMMKAFLEEEGPVLGEFYVEKDEHCLPMINPGAALDDMKIHPDDCPPTSSQ